VSRSPLLLFAVSGSAALLSIGCASRRAVSAAPPVQPPAPPAASAKNPPPSPRSSKTQPVPHPSGYTEEGNASWYGNPFHGRRSSNGETYDMYKLTAAHRTLPFDTMVRVTNLNNGKSTTVRITDRGPFVDNRILDLSLAAAREIESVGPGVVPVRLEVLGDVDFNAGFFTVQVGAFRERSNAERLRDRLSLAYTPIFIQQYDSSGGTFYRLRVGKISGEDAANQLAEQLRTKEGFTTLVFRLDETKSAGVN
jgi:rare lipoprotein A